MIRINVLANFAGRMWPSILSILAVPVYLRYMGVEAYGLIGLFVSFQALISFLDLGLSSTVIREIALGLNNSEKKPATGNLFLTFEIVYGVVSILIANGFYFASHWIAINWVNPGSLSIEVIRLAVIIFGIVLALRWPLALYSGVMQGAERQVLHNSITVIMSTVRAAGSVAAVVLLPQNVMAYLFSQIVFSFGELIVMRLGAWGILKGKGIGGIRRDFSLLSGVWAFSASLSLNSLLAAILKQMDRVLISSFLPLQQVGYYTTANIAYTAISLFATPFSSAAYPRFTALIAEGNERLLAEMYHKLSRGVSFVVAPVASTMIFYSYEILVVWTHSEEVAHNAAPTLSVLAVAALFNLMMYIPYMLQLASGITWIALLNNAISLTVLLPLMYYLISQYGITGAGIAWAVFNVCYYLFVPNIMHRHILPREKMRWIFNDTLPFMAMGVLIFGGFYRLGSLTNLSFFLFLAGGGLTYFLACMIIYPPLRALIGEILTGAPAYFRMIQTQFAQAGSRIFKKK